MPRFMLLYKGEETDMEEMAAEQAAEVIANWNAWMKRVGTSLVDFGTPFGTGHSIVDDGTTGNRAFFVSQRGEIIQTKMNVAVYNVGAPPPWNAALDAAGLGTMGDPLGINGVVAVDGNTWVAV